MNQELVNKYVKELNIKPLIANILINRKVSIQDAKTILTDWHKGINDPRLLLNSGEAVSKIIEYCEDKDAEIYIYGDYDCDGITSAFIMENGLKKVSKCSIFSHVPERIEGYGLSTTYAKSLVQHKEDTNKKILLITVDNGINQVEQIDLLIENGIEVVVTDHHTPNGELPNCICVNPQIESYNTNKHLAGCGVAFKIVQMVYWHYDKGDKMMDFTPYVAIGTIADVMPYSLENMCFIQYGLDIMNSDKCPRTIAYYKDFTGYKMLTAEIIAWNLAPVINACGRMGETNLAYEMFSESYQDTEIEDILNRALKLNDDRKNQTKNAIKQIQKQDFSSDKVCIVKLDDIREGIAGNVAGKVKDMYNKPAIILMGNKELKGSARSIDNININEYIQAEIKKGTIIKGGGHSVAAGLSINEDNVQQLRLNLNEALKDIEFVPIEEKEQEELIVDGSINIEDLSEDMFKEINCIPYSGTHFRNPVLTMNINILRTNNSKNNHDNICFNLANRKQIWAWGFNDRYEELGSPDKISLYGTIDIDFRNKKQYTFQVLDMSDANELS